jgi:HK97 family phage major capsid protein
MIDPAAISQMNDRDANAAYAANLLEQARAIDAELSAKDCDLTDEQRAKREAKAEQFLKEAAERKRMASRPRPGAGRRSAPDSVDRLNPKPIPSRRDAAEAFAAGRVVPLSDWLAADDSQLDDGGFDSLGEFLGAVRDQRTGRRADERLQMMAAAGNYSANDGAGGFLVPDVFQRQLITSGRTDEPWLAMLRRFVVPDNEGGAVVTPVLDDRDRSGKDVAGVALQRVAETKTIPLSTVAFQSKRSELHKAGTLVRVSNELMADNAVGLSETLTDVFSRAVAMRQALDVLGGTGVGEPLGVLNSSAVYEQAAEASQTAGTILGENLAKMRARASGYNGCIWLAHPSTYTQMVTTHLSTTDDSFELFAPSNGQDAPDTLLGRPIYFTEAARLLGERGDVMLFDPSKFIYTLKPLRIDLSTHIEFETDQAVFRVLLRDDGHPLHGATRTDVRGWETSEYVTLAERS